MLGQEHNLSAEDVAKYFLALSDPESEDTLSNLKLQKILYFAQGYFYLQYNRPLFWEKIKAWKDGPVVPQIWHKYKENQGFYIEPINDIDIDSYPEEVRELLDALYTICRFYSAWQLREITHTHSIYIDAWEKSQYSDDDEIKKDDIKEFFTTNFKALLNDDDDQELGMIALDREKDMHDNLVPFEKCF